MEAVLGMADGQQMAISHGAKTINHERLYADCSSRAAPFNTGIKVVWLPPAGPTTKACTYCAERARQRLYDVSHPDVMEGEGQT